MRRSISSLFLAATLWCPVVPAATVATHTTPFDIEALDGRDDVFLTSEVRVDAGVASLHYSLQHNVHDMILDVEWRGQKGNVLLHGGNGFGFLNHAMSLDVEWVGVFFPTVPFVLLQGTADFTNTIGNTSAPCLAGRLCRADYHDWPHNASGSPGGGGGGAGLRAAQVAAAALPSGFESVTETRSIVSGLVPAPTPTDPFATAFAEVFRFTSRVESIAGGFRYLYQAENLTDGEVDFEISALDFSGTLSGSASLSKEVVSAAEPTFVLTEPDVTNEIGASVAVRFDALAPVPEPSAAILMGAGIALLATARWRIRARTQRR